VRGRRFVNPRREGLKMDSNNNNSEIIIYQSADGLTKIDVRMENETLWLTQAQIAELFGRERSVITKHLRNIFMEGELDEKSNVQNLHIPLFLPIRLW